MQHVDWSYPVAPLLAYVVAGSLKFAINSCRRGQAAFREIGMGGLPSTHTTIVATTMFLVGFREGFATPAFAVALTIGLIVVIDAMDLRQKVGSHAAALRRLFPADQTCAKLRPRVGHTPIEVAAGFATALGCAGALSLLVERLP